MTKEKVADGAAEDRKAVVDSVASRHEGAHGALIPILQGVQDELGWLPKDVLERIGERAGVPAAQVFGVVSFYSQFRLKPVGKYVIKVCHGTACHVQGANAITEALRDELKVDDGGTTEDGLFTLESVACLGCCSLAPVMMIEGRTFGRLTPEEARDIVQIVREHGIDSREAGGGGNG
jgi:NADH-quinone oxidoreductase subunit E